MLKIMMRQQESYLGYLKTRKCWKKSSVNGRGQRCLTEMKRRKAQSEATDLENKLNIKARRRLF